MKIDVPYIQQRGSTDCQIATTLMILAFLHHPMSYENLVDELKHYIIDGVGMHSQGHAIFFARNGYQTVFGHHDIDMLDPVIENCTEADLPKLEQHLKSLKETEQETYRVKKLSLDIEFIKAGGQYTNTLPTLSTLDHFLAQNIPIVCGVRNKALHLNPSGGSGNHSVIITGKEGQSYFVNDPSPRTQGQYSVHRDRLLHAWYIHGAHFRAVTAIQESIPLLPSAVMQG